MKKIGVVTVLLACAIATIRVQAATIPTNSLQNWDQLNYRKIVPNDVRIENGSMRIQVNRSASPLIFKLQMPLMVKSFKVNARWSGRLNIPSEIAQGSVGFDDFVLKFGLIEPGETRLNWLQKRIAPDWIRGLHDLAPENSGIRGVNFYSTTIQREQLGVRRTHPLNDLLREERTYFLNMPGAFEMSKTFSEPIEVLGLWISSDGDDTGSTFELTIDNIQLESLK